MPGDGGSELRAIPGNNSDWVQNAAKMWDPLNAGKPFPFKDVGGQDCIEILTTNQSNEPGLMIQVMAGKIGEDVGFNAQREKIQNCIRYLKDGLDIDFLGNNPKQMHFVFRECQLSDFAFVVEKKNDGQVVTSRIWVRDEPGKDYLDRSQRAELLGREIKKYTDQIKDSTDVTPDYLEDEARQLSTFAQVTEQLQAKWEKTKPSQGNAWRYELQYERAGFGAPLCVKTHISINDGLGTGEWTTDISVSDDLRGIKFRDPYKTEIIKQLVAQKGWPDPDKRLSVLLKSPDLEQELLLVELANKEGKPVYAVSDLWVTPRYGGTRSAVAAQGEASEKAIGLMEDFLSEGDQKRNQNERQTEADIVPYNAEAAINVQMDEILHKWRFVLGVTKYSHPVPNKTFVEMSITKDENGNATITSGDFVTDIKNGFYTEALDRKLSLPLNPAYLARTKTDHARCLFDIETDVRQGRFKGEIWPKERCSSEIQDLLSTFDYKINELGIGQVMYIPGGKNNAALFIENQKGNLFVTRIEIMPNIKLEQEIPLGLSAIYDDTKIFPELCEEYQKVSGKE